VPGLRHVLDSRLAFVADQNERQRVRVWSAELVNARALAGFGDRSYTAGFLNCDGVTCERVCAPDLCLWFGSGDVKRTVSIDGPDCAERVGPRPSERAWAGWRSCAGIR
jgi:hypothetical protein